jgi:lipopolysaccharide transport system ATP-binding protein
MTDVAIRVKGLSKQYRIGPRESYKTLRESLTNVFTAPFNRKNLQSAIRNPQSNHPPSSISHPSDFRQSSILHPSSSIKDNYVWALKDVSFEVKHGEVIGIIGPNGAGKTTLLKILSRITEPTEGEVELRGRVSSLLEVGTGFHPELTGRENIYLNGAILGMSKAEINSKFDEIVAFAEIETFLDTPVKHYSTGMGTRLAFAIAAHLEPEILLVDEVLSVGDAAFQKKCLGKMGDVAREGRTVLFVSHNLGSLANLCPRAMLLVQGKKCREGLSSDVISEYIAMGSENQGECVWHDLQKAPGNEKVRLHAVRIVSGGKVTTDVDIQEDVYVQIEFWNLKPGIRISTSIHLLDKMGVGVLASANMHSANLLRDEWFGRPHPTGLFRTTCVLPCNFLNEGAYSINAIVLTDVTNIEVFAREAVSFMVHETGAMRKEYGGDWLGAVRPKLAWQTHYVKPLREGIGME